MAKENQLREMVAAMVNLPPEQIQTGTSLRALDNSLGEAKIRLGLKRLGFRLPAGVRPTTFGELHDLLSANAASPVPAVKLAAAPAGLRVGLDIQDIGSMPEVADYWEDAFYSGAFAKCEIAYAVKQTDPRTHFAGFWCAKEALRKCDPAFAGVKPVMTAVAHEVNGRPYLLWSNGDGETRLPHAISISHAAAIAMAVVMIG